MKGQIGVNELVYGLLFLAAGAAVLLFSSGMLGGLGEMGGGFWERLGNITKAAEEAPTPEYVIAQNSVQALTCSINSVLANKKLDCTKEFQPKSSTGFMGAIVGFVTGAQISPLENGATVDCEQGEQTVMGEMIMEVESTTDFRMADAHKKCSEIYGGNMVAASKTDVKEGSNEFECVTRPLTCTVKNFQLPQEVTGAEEWIAGYGDPQFLVFWQFFPEGEDAAWNSMSAWYQGIGKLMFLTFCVSHIVGPIVKSAFRYTIFKPARYVIQRGGEAVKKAVTWLKGKIGGLKGAEQVSDDVLESVIITTASSQKGLMKTIGTHTLNSEVLKNYGDDVVKFLDDAVAAGTVQEGSTEYFMLKDTFNELAQGILPRESISLAAYVSGPTATAGAEVVSQAIATTVGAKALSIAQTLIKSPRFYAYTGIATLAAYYVSRIDSEFGKFTDIYPNSIVLQGSMSKKLRTPFNIIGAEIAGTYANLSKPIVLDRAEIMSGIVPLTLASPCRADLTVKEENFMCTQYAHDNKNKLTRCDTPNEKGLLGSIENFIIGMSIQRCGEITDLSYSDYDIDQKEIDDLREKEESMIKKMDTVIFRDTDGDGKWDDVVDTLDKITLHFDWEKKTFYEYEYEEDGEKKIKELPPEYVQRREDGEWVKKMLAYCSKPSPYEMDLTGLGDYEEMIECSAPGNPELFFGQFLGNVLAKNVYKSIGRDTHLFTRISVLSDNESGELSNFHTIIIKKFASLTWEWTIIKGSRKMFYLVLRDLNGDGVIDEFGHYVLRIDEETALPTHNLGSSVFTDLDYDGEPDAVVSTNCNIPGLKIKPDLDPYTEDGSGYNFCYQKDYDSALGVISITASFGASALAKTVKGTWGWIIATAVDCSLAYIHYKYGKTPWPGKEY